MEAVVAPQQRLRITFSQQGALRYVGHLDVVRTWERALRRAGVPLAYSAGFNPGPRLFFASGLPLGTTGRAEIADVVLNQPMEPAAFMAAVNAQMPPDLRLLQVEEAPLKSPALQAILQASLWQADVATTLDEATLQARLTTFLASVELPADKRRKGRQVSYDLRPLVLDLRYLGEPETGWQRIGMTLRSAPEATGRADAVLTALGLGESVARIERVQLIF